MEIKLLEQRQLFRRFEITLPGQNTPHLLEWLAGVDKFDNVSVDGQVVAAGKGWGASQDFRFWIGSQPALLGVKLSMMKKVTYFKLIVNGEVVYTEGEAQRSVTPEEMEKLRSPLQPPKLVRHQPATEAVDLSFHSPRSLGVLALIGALFLGVILAWIGPSQGWIVRLGIFALFLVTLYFGLLKLINRTQIHLDRQALEVRRGPLPTTKKKALSLATPEISAFTIKKISRRDSDDGSTRHFYRLQALRKADDPLFIEESDSQPAAVYLQNELNQFLKKISST